MAEGNCETCTENELSENELSFSDSREHNAIDSFFAKGCGYQLGSKKIPCSSTISKELAISARNACLQLDSSELDLVVLAQLQALRTHSQQRVLDACHTSSVRQHSHFYFHKVTGAPEPVPQVPRLRDQY